MKKLMLILILLLGTISFVACGKKSENNNNTNCDGYPAGYVRVTDPNILQILNSGYNGGYSNYNNNNGYNNYNNNNGVICVDQQRYEQLRQQAYGSGNNNVNCQAYPSAPECQYNGGGNNNGGGGNTDPYCDYYPHDPYCYGGYSYGW